MKILFSCLAAALIAGTALPALAQAEPDVAFRRHTVVNLGDEIIDGSLAHPDRMAIEARNRATRGYLIVERANFHREILASVPRR